MQLEGSSVRPVLIFAQGAHEKEKNSEGDGRKGGMKVMWRDVTHEVWEVRV